MATANDKPLGFYVRTPPCGAQWKISVFAKAYSRRATREIRDSAICVAIKHVYQSRENASVSARTGGR